MSDPFADRMAQLRARFAGNAAGEADAIEDALSRGEDDEVRRLAHGLAGRSGMFGYDDLGEIAREAEEADAGNLRSMSERLIAALREVAQER